MKRRVFWLGIVVSLVLMGCDGDDPDDGGVDASLDAGPMDAGPVDAGPPPDAGPVDAGPVDAGPVDAGLDADVDAGPPTPAQVALDVMAARTALDTAVDDVPMPMRLDGAFTDIDIAAAGLDALIGEDGLETLSLSDATVRALADVHTANLIIDALDLAAMGLAERPEVMDVLTQTMALRVQTVAYRDALWRTYRTRLDAGIVGSPVVVESLLSNYVVVANGTSSRLLLVLEGASAGEPEASLSVECFPSEGTVNFTLDVRSVETGASIASTSGADTGSLSVPAAFDGTTAVEVAFEADPPGAMGFVEQCNLSVDSRRRLRTAAVAVPTSDMTFGNAFDTYLMAIADAENQLLLLEGSEDPAVDSSVVAAALDAMMLYRTLMAALVSSDLLPLPVEHYQRIARQVVYVRAMVDAALASAPLAPAVYDTLKTHIATGMTDAETMIGVVGAL